MFPTKTVNHGQLLWLDAMIHSLAYITDECSMVEAMHTFANGDSESYDSFVDVFKNAFTQYVGNFVQFSTEADR